MKRFITRTLLFMLPVIGLLMPLDLLISSLFSNCSSVSFTGGEFTVWNDIYDKKINADIAIYGSSRAWVHYNPSLLEDSLGHTAYNFGVDGHNFWIQYLRHKIYTENNPAPKVIILSVDYFTLQKREDLFNYAQFLPYMLWDENIMKYTSSYKGFQKNDFRIPLLRYVGKTNLIMKSISTLLQEGSLAREKGFAGRDIPWTGDLKKAQKTSKTRKVILDEGTLELFDQFLKECQENGIEVLMVYSPVYFKGLEYLENSKESKEVLKSFAKKYELDFLDYTNHEICYDTTYFYNASHLNKKGVDVFTNLLIQDLKNINIPERINN